MLRTLHVRSQTTLSSILKAPLAEDAPSSGDHFRPIRSVSFAFEFPSIFRWQSDLIKSHRGDRGNRSRREARNIIVLLHIHWTRRYCGPFGSWGLAAFLQNVRRNFFERSFFLSHFIMSYFVELNHSFWYNYIVKTMNEMSVNVFEFINYIRLIYYYYSSRINSLLIVSNKVHVHKIHLKPLFLWA